MKTVFQFTAFVLMGVGFTKMIEHIQLNSIVALAWQDMCIPWLTGLSIMLIIDFHQIIKLIKRRWKK